MNTNTVSAIAYGRSFSAPPGSAFVQLLKKELRLQRGNLVFGLAATVLGFAGLWLIRSNPQNLGGFPPADIQNSLMMAALLPVLILILPAMIGSTAAAAEKSLGVLPWQDALPVPRWKIILVKTIIIIAACAVVAGVLPYILRPLLMDSDTVPGLFRGFWTGLHGIVFGAIGFYAGSFAKDDYQGLLLAIIPAAAVVAALVLPDYFGKVLPVLAPYPLTRPWAIVIRLLAVAALLILLASKMHLRIPTRRWRPMLTSLIIVFCGGILLTLWNLHIEGTVLGAAPPSGIDVTNRLAAAQPGYKVVSAEPIARVTRGWMSYEPMTPIHLASGKTVAIGNVSISEGRGSDMDSHTMVMVGSDGNARQFPQVFYSTLELSGLSKNQDWILMEAAGERSILFGPYSLTIPLHLLPDAISNRIVKAAQIDYATDTYTGASLPWDHLSKAPDDIPLTIMQNRGIVWKDGKSQIPPGSHPRSSAFMFYNSIMFAEITKADKTTLTAVLRPSPAHGVYELTGYVNGWTFLASEDGQWVRGDSEQGAVYRQVEPWQQAQKRPPLKTPAPGRLLARETKTRLPEEKLLISSPLAWQLPVIETTSGPATIEVYTISDRTTDTANSGYGDPSKTRLYEVGLNIVNLESGTTQTIPLRQSPETSPLKSWDYTIHKTPTKWCQESKTMALYYQEQSDKLFQQDVRFADFSDFINTTPEELRASMIIAPSGERGGMFIGERQFMQYDNFTLYLSTW